MAHKAEHGTRNAATPPKVESAQRGWPQFELDRRFKFDIQEKWRTPGWRDHLRELIQEGEKVKDWVRKYNLGSNDKVTITWIDNDEMESGNDKKMIEFGLTFNPDENFKLPLPHPQGAAFKKHQAEKEAKAAAAAKLHQQQTHGSSTGARTTGSGSGNAGTRTVRGQQGGP